MRMLCSRLVQGYLFQENNKAGWGKPGEKWASACTGRYWGKHRTRGQNDEEKKKALNPQLVEGRWEERGLSMGQINREGFFSNSFAFY